MELHHDKHHNTYVNSLNAAMEKMEELQAKGDLQGQIAQQPLINFHGGMEYNSTTTHPPMGSRRNCVER